MYTPLEKMEYEVFAATPIQGRHMFTSTPAHTQKLSLQCHGASTSIIVDLPIIWWCFWNETCRRLGNYWERLENILNSAAWRSQCRHSSSYHDDHIVHHSGCCESSDWLSGRGSLMDAYNAHEGRECCGFVKCV